MDRFDFGIIVDQQEICWNKEKVGSLQVRKLFQGMWKEPWLGERPPFDFGNLPLPEKIRFPSNRKKHETLRRIPLENRLPSLLGKENTRFPSRNTEKGWIPARNTGMGGPLRRRQKKELEATLRRSKREAPSLLGKENSRFPSSEKKTRKEQKPPSSASGFHLLPPLPSLSSSLSPKTSFRGLDKSASEE